MRKLFVSASVVLLCAALYSCMAATAFAHPPSGMTLSYDKEKEVLHIDISHVTHRPRKHFIRKVVVSKNEGVIDTVSFVQQTSSTALAVDVPVSAVAGDTLSVKAICSEAGIARESLTVL